MDCGDGSWSEESDGRSLLVLVGVCSILLGRNCWRRGAGDDLEI